MVLRGGYTWDLYRNGFIHDGWRGPRGEGGVRPYRNSSQSWRYSGGIETVVLSEVNLPWPANYRHNLPSTWQTSLFQVVLATGPFVGICDMNSERIFHLTPSAARGPKKRALKWDTTACISFIGPYITWFLLFRPGRAPIFISKLLLRTFKHPRANESAKLGRPNVW